ncbi:MAG: S1C family serine protease [Oculatellaceae cyanobacterium Prado106]|nr:S1C family serine protease [Oculatellaceae cyanobacterium Prado106]
MTNAQPGFGSFADGFADGFADVVERAGQAVVAVQGSRRMPSSGVVWRSQLIVTSEEALRQDEDIPVVLADGRRVTAQLVARDPGTDVAILRVEETDLTLAELGDSSLLRVGHWGLAIARLPESGLSASLGIISTLGGSWRSQQGGRIDQLIRPDFIPAPGFSGSALVNVQGQIVGMNTTGSRGLALTIPRSTIDRVVDLFLSRGQLTRGYLGVGMQPVQLPENLRESLNWSESRGVLIVSLEPEGPAAQAGLMLGDIVVSLRGQAVQDIRDVHNTLEPELVGQPLLAQVIRGGSLLEISIVVGDRPSRDAEQAEPRRRGGCRPRR